MTPTTIVYSLSAFIFLIGWLGLYRTGSWIPVIISGAIALITFALGYWRETAAAGSYGHWALIGWLVICVGLFLASAFELVGAHTNPQPGSRWIFLSEALFAVLALIAVVMDKK
jgi:hypothetical protein